ncbi:hypothetical protein ES702_02956 [subsurface metagenome]
MVFISLNQLYIDIRQLALDLPAFDIIAGVPRSGMIAAGILSSHLNLSLASVDRANGLIILQGGVRDSPTPGKKILVLDDSAHSAFFTTWIHGFLSGYDVKTAAIYVEEEVKGRLDYWSKICPQPRLFSWGFMNCDLLKIACIDMDGVLCVNPTNNQNDDGPRYKDFLINTTQIYRPLRRPIHSIVSSRMEKHRSLTEAWLKKHNIAYTHLILTNYMSASDRQKDNRYAELKAEYYKSVNCGWFVESDPLQAKRIGELTGKPVICSETLESFNMVAI